MPKVVTKSTLSCAFMECTGMTLPLINFMFVLIRPLL